MDITTNNSYLCETVPPRSNSDHLGLLFAVTVFKSKSCPKRSGRRVWRYAYADCALAQTLLNAIDRDLLFRLPM